MLTNGSNVRVLVTVSLLCHGVLDEVKGEGEGRSNKMKRIKTKLRPDEVRRDKVQIECPQGERSCCICHVDDVMRLGRGETSSCVPPNQPVRAASTVSTLGSHTPFRH